MASNRFKINHYNWFSQKLLALHRYDEILKVRQYLTGCDSVIHYDEMDDALVYQEDLVSVSDHMNYLTGLALMKTRSVPSERLVFTLQKLNYQKNGQYLLLLCKCLLYMGNHDSVVAICMQVLNKEIDTVGSASIDDAQMATTEDNDRQKARQKDWCLKSICEESLEFKSMFESVNKNRRISDPRLWFVFAFSLELQMQLKDADLAYRIASKLASGQARQLTTAASVQATFQNFDSNLEESIMSSVPISHYTQPHTKYAEFCVRYRNDHKTALQVLSQASSVHSTAAINYSLSPALALAMCTQPNANASHFTKADEILQALDNYSASTRNPSFEYNRAALRCKQKLSLIYANEPSQTNLTLNCTDEKRLSLSYTLIKSFVIINNIVQCSTNEPMLFKWPVVPPQATSASSSGVQMQIDRAIKALRGCDSNCWQSHSLWNNLGICYLMKRRYVASLSCFIKALQLCPLDWRINYNIGLAHSHVNVSIRALACSLAAKSYLDAFVTRNQKSSLFMGTMMATCYSSLGLGSEARRYYAEMIALGRQGGPTRAPVLAIVNYLLLLHKANDLDNSGPVLLSDQDSKLLIQLLDQLEQDWLQRNQNDSQFVKRHLEVAREIADSLQISRPQMRKSYAWTKY